MRSIPHEVGGRCLRSGESPMQRGVHVHPRINNGLHEDGAVLLRQPIQLPDEEYCNDI